MYGNGAFCWGDSYGGWGVALSFLPINKKGESDGCFGYTCFSIAGSRGLNHTADGGVLVTARNNGETITIKNANSLLTPTVEVSPSTVTASIDISLLLSIEDLNQMADYYNEKLTQTGNRPTLKVSFNCSVIEGDEINTQAFNNYSIINNSNNPSVIENGTWSIQPGTEAVNSVAGATYTYNNISLEELNMFCESKWTFHFVDDNIKVQTSNAGKTALINKYTATATLIWSNGETKTFSAVGNYKEADGITAYDLVKWKFSSEETGTSNPKVTFYSIPSNAYAEIKDNVPGSENYEAMAGVPTTEDMYVGFGATEFMVNMDAVWRKQSDTGSLPTRTYTFSYKVKCVDNQERDTGYCTAHPNSTCTNSHTLYDYCTGTYYTVKGCYVSEHNSAGDYGASHPQNITFTGTVTQNIEDFAYMDITALDLWRVSELIYEPEDEIFNTTGETKTVDTGYAAYYTQNEYTGGNGRLYFHTAGEDGSAVADGISSSESSVYGDYEIAYVHNNVDSDEAPVLYSNIKTTANNFINNALTVVNNAKVKATVISDYCVLKTTNGYQSIMYAAYDSDEVSLLKDSSTRFTFDQTANTVATVTPMNIGTDKTNNITFNTAWTVNVNPKVTTVPVGSVLSNWQLDNTGAATSLYNLWVCNPYSAIGWCNYLNYTNNPASAIMRTGYTGNYANPDDKWDNSKEINADVDQVFATDNVYDWNYKKLQLVTR